MMLKSVPFLLNAICMYVPHALVGEHNASLRLCSEEIVVSRSQITISETDATSIVRRSWVGPRLNTIPQYYSLHLFGVG
jgi:hypothetical protein